MKVIKYEVFDSDMPAILPECFEFSESKFDSFEDALGYVQSWLGRYIVNIPHEWDGSRFYYNASRSFIEIRKSEEEIEHKEFDLEIREITIQVYDKNRQRSYDFIYNTNYNTHFGKHYYSHFVGKFDKQVTDNDENFINRFDKEARKLIEASLKNLKEEE